MNSTRNYPTLDEQQASLWAARLDGSVLTAADRAALDSWLDADPARRVLLSSYCQFSTDLERQLPLLAGIRDEWVDIKTAAKSSQPFPWLSRPRLAGMALMAVAAAVAVVLWPTRPQNQFQNISTSVAQRQTVDLADGSHLELNAQTAAVIELSADARHVRLASGEAFFQVSKDPNRPFFVETPAGLIRVTGTQFNVRLDPAAGLEVTVLEGTVQVRPSGAPSLQSLHAGDQLTCTHHEVNTLALSKGQLSDVLAWRQGQIVFNGTPLREALDRFARYHGRSISTSDAAGRLLIGGRYSLDDLDGFLASLEDGVLPIRVSWGRDGAIQVDANP